MSYCVYGIRLKGDREVRYVGQTSGKHRTRLSHLVCERGGRWNPADPFYQWLTAHRGSIESFEIARCGTRAEAVGTERVVISLCLRLDHRLFNRDHVPQHLRLAA